MVCGLSRDKGCVTVLGIKHKWHGTLCLVFFFCLGVFFYYIFFLYYKPFRHICIIFYNAIRKMELLILLTLFLRLDDCQTNLN